MRPVTIKQLSVVSGAFLFLVLLLFARTTPAIHSLENKTDKTEQIFASLVGREKAALSKKDQNKISVWEEGLKKKLPASGKSFSDSLIRYWSEAKKPLIAALYAKKKAENTGVPADWADAGKRFLVSARFSKEEDKTNAYSSAIRCLQYAYSKDSLNLQTQTQLGVSYVEGSSDPMKGIALLKGVVEKDPENLEAQLNLGLFSVKSGQYGKAVERFEKIIKIDPSYVEIYLFLANAYERMGNNEKAIEALEKYKSLVDDNMIRTEVQNYINNLKKQ